MTHKILTAQALIVIYTFVTTWHMSKMKNALVFSQSDVHFFHVYHYRGICLWTFQRKLLSWWHFPWECICFQSVSSPSSGNKFCSRYSTSPPTCTTLIIHNFPVNSELFTRWWIPIMFLKWPSRFQTWHFPYICWGIKVKITIKPLTLRTELHVTSPHNIDTF